MASPSPVPKIGITALFVCLCTVVCAWPQWATGQHLAEISRTAQFIDYEFTNERLEVGMPEFLMAPWHEGTVRFEILEHETRTVTVDSSRIHYVNHPEKYLLGDLQTPLIESGDPGYYRGDFVAPLTIHVARQAGLHSFEFEVLRHAHIRVFTSPAATAGPGQADRAAATLSDVSLTSGTWYKIPIPEDGIYALDAEYLEEAGVHIAQSDPRNIRIYSTPGYELPHRNADPRPRLTEIPVLLQGGQNGQFSSDVRILFYANGPNRVWREEQSGRFAHRLHPYSTVNYVFLTVGSEPGPRLEPTEAQGDVQETRTTFHDFRWLEQDREKSESRIKSGTQWFGQALDPTSSTARVLYADTLSGLLPGSSLDFHLLMAARATVTSRFEFSVNNYTSFPPLSVLPIASLTDATGVSARTAEIIHSVPASEAPNDIVQLSGRFINPQSESRGWVVWIRLEAERRLQALNGRLLFHAPFTADNHVLRYELNGFSSEPLVLDITDPLSPVMLQTRPQGNNFAVTHRSHAHSRFHAANTFRRPAQATVVPASRLRQPSGYPDYIIITEESLLDEARRLAEHRQQNDGLYPVVATQNEIFNEFNGGVPDFVALRDYVKFLYDRATADGERRPEYLLFFGNTTYDYKGVLQNPVMQNLVFTYQSEESVHRTNSYGSDDFFGFMGDNEGLWPRIPSAGNPRNLLDVAVGRLPVQTVEEARLMVDKILHYENPRNRGDWQSLFTFIADDDVAGRSNDRDLHILNADGTADVIDRDQTGIRLDKIYQISFPFENTSAGRRVPEATRAMINRINEGTLVFNFSGHGSEQFLTDQRLFTSDDIPRLTNRDRLSIMVTATCSFGRFDDSDDYSGAEKMMLFENGGLIAAFTTTRVVYTSPSPTTLNFGLNIALTREMTRRDEDGQPRRLGDIFRSTKITPVGSDFNARKFILLGDPAMRIGLPQSGIAITHISDEQLDSQQLLELRSLDEITIRGHVSQPDGTVDSGFNGEATVRVFDAERLVSYPDLNWVQASNCYLQNCGYLVQTDALFNGRVRVTDGWFESRFIIPRDVSYAPSSGRIQVYALDREADAVGSGSGFRISSQNPDAVNDGIGPRIDLYMNDEMFASGGLVNEAPRLIALLEDNSGINTTGAGVGHEIVAILEGTGSSTLRETIVLNEFYQSELDDYRRGRIEYPFENLPEGEYLLRVRAWDVFNNMGESEILFQVRSAEELHIRNVFNYPNPMHNFTSFMFEHNQPGIPMDVRIRIYTPAGRPVATIREEQLMPAGNMVRIDWYGMDDDYRRLGTGTYLYHVQVVTHSIDGRNTKDVTERLVILR